MLRRGEIPRPLVGGPADRKGRGGRAAETDGIPVVRAGHPPHHSVFLTADVLPERLEDAAADILFDGPVQAGRKNRFHRRADQAEFPGQVGGGQVGGGRLAVVNLRAVIVRRQGPARVIAELLNDLFERGEEPPLVFDQFGHRQCHTPVRPDLPRVLVIRPVPIGVEFLVKVFGEFRNRLGQEFRRPVDDSGRVEEGGELLPHFAVVDRRNEPDRLGGDQRGELRGPRVDGGTVFRRRVGGKRGQRGRYQRGGQERRKKKSFFHRKPFRSGRYGKAGGTPVYSLGLGGCETSHANASARRVISSSAGRIM